MFIVWTKKGNWKKFEVTKSMLENLKDFYYNFYYKEIGSNKIFYHTRKIK